MLLPILGLLFIAAEPDLWLRRVEPVMSKDERSLYQSLPNERARESFRLGFWGDKAISESDYIARIDYADHHFGSGQIGSGANTDQGRLYLAIGPPTSIQRLPSSRVLYPNEIWYYDHVPGLQTKSRLQFLFFRPRDLGVMRLYSPQIHTLRALIINNAGTRGLFPVNDVITEGDVLNNLKLSPAELDVVDAALSVAKGIKGSGNSEILYLASSPREMLSHKQTGLARSRVSFATERPLLTIKQYATPNKVPAIDVDLKLSVRSSLTVEVRDLESFETRLNFATPTPLHYTQRLFLLPGEYTLLVDVDGFKTGFVLKVEKLSPNDPATPELIAPSEANAILYRANLYPGADFTAIGRQYLQANDLSRATACYKRALALARSLDALTGLARIEARNAKLDAARSLLEEALQIQPNHFEALVALAGITAEFQDYPLATTYYKKAQAIKQTPFLTQALALLASH